MQILCALRAKERAREREGEMKMKKKEWLFVLKCINLTRCVVVKPKNVTIMEKSYWYFVTEMLLKTALSQCIQWAAF